MRTSADYPSPAPVSPPVPLTIYTKPKHLCRASLARQLQLQIIDEIGNLPIDRQGANLFFQLVSRGYERGSIIITSNQSLGAWGEVSGDPVIASAILDRLLHHSITIDVKGDSFRLKEKLKAGLLKPKLDIPADE